MTNEHSAPFHVRTVPRSPGPAGVIGLGLAAMSGAAVATGLLVLLAPSPACAQPAAYGYGQGFSTAAPFAAFGPVAPSVGIPQPPSAAPWYMPTDRRVGPIARVRQLREPAPPNGCVLPSFRSLSGDDAGACYR